MSLSDYSKLTAIQSIEIRAVKQKELLLGLKISNPSDIETAIQMAKKCFSLCDLNYDFIVVEEIIMRKEDSK